MNKKEINKGIIDFYCKKFNKCFPKNLNIENPYDIQEFIFKVTEHILNKCDKTGDYTALHTIYPEDNLENIFKELGYTNKDIVFTYKNMERLDFDGDWDKINYIFSYKYADDCANTELSFISYFGSHSDPIDIIQFIYFTILNYENAFDWNTYHE